MERMSMRKRTLSLLAALAVVCCLLALFMSCAAAQSEVTLEVMETEPLLNDHFRFMFDAPGATYVRLKLVDAAGEVSYKEMDRRDSYVQYSDITELNMLGAVTFYAEACYDELPPNFDWMEMEYTGVSNGVAVNPQAPNGAGSEPQVSVPETVQADSLLGINVALQSGDERYSVSILNANGDAVYFYDNDFHEVANGEFFTYVSTDGLDEGVYSLTVGTAGFGREWTSFEGIAQFTVSGAATDIQFEIPQTDLLLGDSFQIVVAAPGAQDIYLNCIREDGSAYWEDNRDGWNGAGALNRSAIIFERGAFDVYAYVSYDGENYETRGPIRMNISSNGKLGDPPVYAPSLVKPGEDVSVSFDVVDCDGVYAGEYKLELIDYMTGDMVLSDIYLKFDETYTIPASMLTPGHRYGIGIGAGAFDKHLESSYGSKELYVLAEQDSRVTLSIENTHPLVEEEMGLTIDAPGAERVAICVANENDIEFEWHSIEPDEQDGFSNLSVGWLSYWLTGEKMVYARVWFENPNDDDACVLSNVVDIEVWANAEATPAGIEVPETVVRGALLPVLVTPQDGSSRHYVRIFSTGEEPEEFYNREFADQDEAFTAYMPTSMLEVGKTYRVSVFSRGLGLAENVTAEDVGLFTVTEGDVAPQVVVPSEDMLIHREYGVIATVPGATNAVMMWYDAENEKIKEVNDGWNEELGLLEQSIRFDEPGDYYAKVRITYDHFANWEDIGPFPVHVYANGELEQAEITAPELLNPGEDLVFSVGGVEHVDNFYVGLWDCTANEEVWSREAPGEYTIESALLQPGHIYNINALAGGWGTGYVDSSNQVTVIVLSDEEHADNITIELGDVEEVYVNESFPVRIKAPDATFVRLYSIDGGGVWDVRNDEGDYTDFTFKIEVNDTAHLYARASYDEHGEDFDPNELTYGNWSNIVTVRPTSLGQGTVPDVSIPETIAWGELLPVEISVSSDTIDADIHILKADIGSDDYGQDTPYYAPNFRNFDASEPLMGYVPTLELEPGHRYAIKVLARGFGQNWCNWDEGWEFFEVLPNDEAGPSCAVNPQRQLINKNFSLVVTVPGAQGIYLHWTRANDAEWCRDDGSYEWIGSGIKGYDGFELADTYTAHVMVTYDGEENWDEVASFEVEYYSNGQLEEPKFTAPDVLEPGEDLVINVEDVENADDYSIDLYDCIEDNSLWISNKSGEITVESAQLTPGHRYVINVHAYGRNTGYEESYSSAELVVLSDEEHADNVTFELGDVEEIFVMENFPVCVKAPDATFVRLYQVEEPGWFWDVWADEGDYTDFAFEISVDKTMHLYARASYDEHGEDFDPNELTYGNWSNIVVVRPISLGQGTVPDVSIPETIAWGELLPVEISVSSDTIDADIHILKADIGSDDYGQDTPYYAPNFRNFDASEPLMGYVPTLELEPGHRYAINVLARGFGQDWCGWNEGWKFFEVEPNDDPQPYYAVTPERQLICEDFDVLVTVPGAKGIYLHWSRVEDGLWDRDESYEWIGSGVHGRDSFPECGTYRAQVMATYDDENWEEALSFEVEIYAKGQLDMPVIDAPEFIEAGQDLVVNIGVVENAEEYVFGVIDPETKEAIVEDMLVEPGEQVVLAELLQPGHVYEIGAYVMAYGIQYNPCWAGKYVFVSETENGTAELTLDKTDVLVNEEIGCTVNAPDASFVRIYARSEHGGEWMHDVWPDNGYENRKESIDCFGDPGTYYVYARPCYYALDDEYDPNELIYDPMSNIVVVHASSNGCVEPVEISVPETVAYGELLRVDVTPNNSDAYWISLMIDEGEENWRDIIGFAGPRSAEPFTVYLPTTGLEVGQSARVQIWATAVGLEGQASWSDITVTEGETEPIIMITPDEVMYGGYAQGVVSAPGATDIIVTKSREDGTDSWTNEFYGCNGYACFNESYRDDQFGVINYVARISYDNGETWTELEPVSVNVQTRGTLDQPEVNAPTIINADEDFVFTIGEVENACEYIVRLYDESFDEQTINWQLVEPGRNVISASKLVPGHTYVLDVGVAGYVNGYAGEWVGMHFTVHQQPDDRVTLSIERERPRIYEPFGVTIDAPDAMRIDLCVVNPDGIDFIWERIEPDEENGYSELYLDWPNYWMVGEGYLFVRAWYGNPDDEYDFVESNHVGFEVWADGEGTPAQIELPETVARGALLGVNIVPQGGNDRITVKIRGTGEEFEEFYFTQYDPQAEPFTAYLPTTMLEVGKSYRVVVGSGMIGKAEVDTDDTVGLFTVTEDDTSVSIVIQPEEPLFGREFKVIVSAPGATNVVTMWYKADEDEELIEEKYDGWNEEIGLLNQSNWLGMGDYLLRVRVTYDSFNEYEDYGPFEVYVTSNGKLDKPQVHMPTTLEPGQDLVVTFDPVEHAEAYELYLWNVQEYDELLSEISVQPGEPYTIPGDMLYAGQDYGVSIKAIANKGCYEPSDSEAYCYIIPEIDDRLTVSIENPNPALYGSFGKTTVSLPSADSIDLFLIRDGKIVDEEREIYPEEQQYVEFDDHFDVYVNWKPELYLGEHYLFARAYMDGGYVISNLVKFQVTKEGDGTPARIEVPETVVRGDLLGVRVFPQDDNDKHAFVLYGTGRKSQSTFYYLNYPENTAEPFTAYLPTAELEAGETYRVAVRSGKLGHAITESEKTVGLFTVTDGEPTASVVTMPANPKIYREFATFISLPNIDSLESVVWYSEDGERLKDEDSNEFDHECGLLSIVNTFDQVGCYQLKVDWYSNEGDHHEEIFDIHVGANGKLEHVTIDAPTLLEAGENLVFSVEGVEHADSYRIIVYDCMDDREIWARENLGEFTIESAELTPGHSYNINVDAWGLDEGYESSFNRVTVIVLSDEEHDDNITFEFCNNDEIFVNEEFPLHIKAPGATFMRLYRVNNEGWIDDIWVDEFDYSDFKFRTVADDTAYLYVRVSYDKHGDEFDPNELNYGPWSNILTVHPISLGQGKPANVSAPETIAWGELLPVEVSLNDESTRVNIGVFYADGYPEEYGEFVYGTEYQVSDPSQPLTLYVPTANLEPGHRYGINLMTRGYGQNWCDTEGKWTIFEVEENDNPQPHYIVTPERQLICESFEVLVTVPNAKRMYLHWSRAEDGAWERDRSYDWIGSGVRGTEDFPESDTYRAEVMVSYEEEGDENWEEAFSFEVEIYAKGQLAKPVIDVPEIVKAGENLVVNVGVIENAEEYVFGVIDAETDEAIIQDNLIEPGEQIIPAELLQPGHSYEVGVYAMAYGIYYNPSWAGKIVFVSDTENGTAELSLSKTDILINEEVNFTVNAPDASFVRVYARRDYGDERSWDVWPDGPYEDRTESFDWFDNPGTYYVYARACYDDIGDDYDPEELDYGPMSNIVIVHAVASGDAMPAKISIPETVVCGELLRVDVTPQNSDSFDINLMIENEDEGYWENIVGISGPKGNKPFTVYLPTAGLEPGKKARVEVWTKAVGLNGASSWKEFTATEGETEPIFKFMPEQPTLGDSYQIVLSAPGATNARYTCTNDRDPEVWEDTLWGRDGSFSNSGRIDGGNYGVLTFYPEVSYDDGDSWTKLEPVVVNVAVKGILDMPKVELRRLLEPGEDFVFSFGAVEHATDYILIVNDDTLGECIFKKYVTEAGKYVVPASKMIPGHSYSMNVGPEGLNNGYAWGEWAYETFYVRGPKSEDITISVENPNTIPTEEVEFTINAPGATFVRLYDVLNSGNWINIDPKGGYENRKVKWAIWNSGTRYIVATATYDKVEEDTDPNSLNYTAMSDVLEIHQAEYTGKGTVADFTIPASVTCGDFLPVDITLKNGDDQFAVFFFSYENNYEEWLDSYSYYLVEGDDDPHQVVMIPTANKAPGDFYYLEVWTSQIGKEWVRSPKRRFTVTEPEDHEVYFTIEHAEALVNEGIFAIVSAPGCEKIYISAYDENGEKVQDFKKRWSGECGYIRCTFEEPGVYDLYAEVSYADETPSKREGPIQVTVIMGDAEIPEFEAPAKVGRGEKLAVQIMPAQAGMTYKLSILDGDKVCHTQTIEKDSAETFTVNLPTSKLAAGKTYGVQISVGGKGYVWATTETKNFSVVEVNLTTLKLPAKLTEIEEEAFEGMNTQKIVLPAGITSIGSRAFADCSELAFVVFTDDVESIADDAFDGSENLVFICKAGSKAAAYAEKHGIDAVEN